MAGQNLERHLPRAGQGPRRVHHGHGRIPQDVGQTGPADEDWIAGAPVKRADGSTGAVLVTGWSYRYFARHLQEALKTHLLDEAKAAGQEGKLPVFYTAVFDKAGVYASPLTPDVDAKALASQDLVGKTESGPATGTLTIDDRPFGFAAQRTPSLAPGTGVVVLRSDDMSKLPLPSEPVDSESEQGPARDDEEAPRFLLGLGAAGRTRADDRRGRRDGEP